MFPYGWQLPDGSVLREAQFSGMVAVANSSYWRWVNTDAQNAFLRQCARRLALWAPCIIISHLVTVSSTVHHSFALLPASAGPCVGQRGELPLPGPIDAMCDSALCRGAATALHFSSVPGCICTQERLQPSLARQVAPAPG